MQQAQTRVRAELRERLAEAGAEAARLHGAAAAQASSLEAARAAADAARERAAQLGDALDEAQQRCAAAEACRWLCNSARLRLRTPAPSHGVSLQLALSSMHHHPLSVFYQQMPGVTHYGVPWCCRVTGHVR